jgi:NAD(P)H-nitrite reductase large subunit
MYYGTTGIRLSTVQNAIIDSSQAKIILSKTDFLEYKRLVLASGDKAATLTCPTLI